MDLTQLANLGEFIGGVAVLVTLIYLAAQVRQSTKAQRHANEHAKADALHNAATIHSTARQMLMNEETSAILLKARNDDELSPNEGFRLIILLQEIAFSTVAAASDFEAAGSQGQAAAQPRVVAGIVGQSATLRRIWSTMAAELADYGLANFADAVTAHLDEPVLNAIWMREGDLGSRRSGGGSRLTNPT